MARKPKFQVGDHVFYPSAGVGEIEGIEDIIIGGSCEACYVIRVQDSGMVVKVPQANTVKNGIRPLISSRKVNDLYRVLNSECKHRVTGGNWTERCKEIERRINGSSSMGLAEVVRDLMSWKLESGLSFEESMLLETASNYLAQELALAKGIPPNVAYETIVSHITKSSSDTATA